MGDSARGEGRGPRTRENIGGPKGVASGPSWAPTAGSAGLTQGTTGNVCGLSFPIVTGTFWSLRLLQLRALGCRLAMGQLAANIEAAAAMPYGYALWPRPTATP